MAVQPQDFAQPHVLFPFLDAWLPWAIAAAMELGAGVASLCSRNPAHVLVAPSLCLVTLAGDRALVWWIAVESPGPLASPIAASFAWDPKTEATVALSLQLGCLVLITAAWWCHLRDTPSSPFPKPLPPRAPEG